MRPLGSFAFFALSLALAASGCGGVVSSSSSDGGNAGSGSSDGGPGSSGNGTSGNGATSSTDAGGSGGSGGSSGSGGTGTGSSSDAGTAACPTVVLQAPQSQKEAVTAVEGRWQICQYSSSLSGWAPPDTVGMEFTPATSGGGACPATPAGGCMGGLVYFLVQGSSGLVRGSGNSYQIWYSVDATSFALTLAQAPNNGTWSTSISASSSPREVWIEQLNYKDGPRLVAVQ